MELLIVEDVAAEAEMVADMVRHHGHQATVAATAEVALERVLAASPDAVLLDLRLPGMHGLEFLRILAECRVGVPVVAISGAVTEDEARRSLELGAVEFLPKPLTLDQLRVVLDFLELGVLTRRLTGDLARLNRRRYPRVAVALDVVLEQAGAPEERGQSVDVSPFGLKVRFAAEVQPGGTVRLSFQPPDGQRRLSVLSLVVRQDPDGAAASFIDLTHEDFQRLKRFVDGRLGQPPAPPG